MTRPERVHCPECGQQFIDQGPDYAQDFLVDHLADVHDLYSWVTEGRPAPDRIRAEVNADD